MKDYTYTYNNNNQPSLHHGAFHWLGKIGFKETQWILDTRWISRDYNLAFQEWIDK